ncbi:MAG: MGH1-like glycoside hydrolase domain-containing protein [Acidimicrobiales bacterium]
MTLSHQLRTAVHDTLHHHWVDAGYTAPNDVVYPWQWLWDSCFHALIWHELGRTDRALTELTQALSTQTPGGFVPHMNYQLDPDAHADLWGRSGASSITQPPMFGHAVAQLVRDGVDVPVPLIDQAEQGLRFLLERRARTPDGLVELCHPWESGADNSPRWDDLCPGGFDEERWRQHKSDLVARIERDADGAAIHNPDFAVGSIGFNALIAFNARELADGAGRRGVGELADALVPAIEQRWRGDGWADAGPAERSGMVRTADSMLALLVVSDAGQKQQGWQMVDDPDGFAARYGPRGVHGEEPGYDPQGYWRGPCWPQLAYLLWWGATVQGRAATAASLAESTVAGAEASALAEYWNADSGSGLGAIPQSWAGLVLLMDRRAAAAPRA